ncbi:hypothetical protein ACFE04_009140 [Oxalis oulophora]
MWTQQHFKPKPNHVFLISNLKSGTTWLKALVFAIINRTKFHFSSHPLLTHNPHQLVPFLEIKLFMKLPIGDPEFLPSPRILASHIPYGISPYGPYWDHTLGYWKASLEFPDRVLFLKYEHLKDNSLLHVKNLADFLNQGFTKEEEENGVVQEIVKLCSFESLSNMDVNKNGTYREHLKNNIFFRKCTTGDWKEYLTSEMSERLDQITEHKLKDSGLTFKG